MPCTCRSSRDRTGAVLIVEPDFGRRIDLPGAGPCPRPIDIDRGKVPLAQLVSLRVYSFAAGKRIDGEAEDDEVFIVLMRGGADIVIDQAGRSSTAFTLHMNGVRAVYMPPHAAYHLAATDDADIAYVRATPAARPLPMARGFAPSDGRLDVPDHATSMALSLRTLGAGERLTFDGMVGERFVHVRTDVGAARLAGEPIGDWYAAVCGGEDVAALTVEHGTIEVMTVHASAGRRAAAGE